MQLRRHLTPIVVGVALVLALTGIGVAAAVDAQDDGPVVNKNGHVVNDHADFGQDTAEDARSKHDGEEDGPGLGLGQGQGQGNAFGHMSPEEKEQAKADWKAEHQDDADEGDGEED